jgi:hypothetical protein
MKVTRTMVSSLRQQLGSNDNMKDMQVVLDYQGYFATRHGDYYPEFSAKGRFIGWRVEPAVIAGITRPAQTEFRR